jgi:hypothetical protein
MCPNPNCGFWLWKPIYRFMDPQGREQVIEDVKDLGVWEQIKDVKDLDAQEQRIEHIKELGAQEPVIKAAQKQIIKDIKKHGVWRQVKGVRLGYGNANAGNFRPVCNGAAVQPIGPGWWLRRWDKAELIPDVEPSGTTASMTPPPTRRLRDKATEARDKYIYDEWQRGTGWEEIQRVVNATQGWRHLGRRQSVRAAADRYQKRHPHLPALHPREPGP